MQESILMQAIHSNKAVVVGAISFYLDHFVMAVRATLPLQFLVLKSRSSGSQTIHARDNPHKG